MTDRATINAAAHRFAKLNGWERSRREFSLAQLGRAPPYTPWTYRSPNFPLVMRGDENYPRIMDHLDFFKLGPRPICLISQPYVPPGSIEAARVIADVYDLHVFEPPEPKSGWYLPGSVTIFAFVSIGVKVHWLPEQCEPPRTASRRAAKLDRETEQARCSHEGE